MTPPHFRTVRLIFGSQRASAKRLGIGFRTLQRIEAGTMGDPIPEKYAHMINGLSAKPFQTDDEWQAFEEGKK